MTDKIKRYPLLVKRTVVAFTIALAIGMLVVISIYFIANEKVHQPISLSQAELITINPGASLNSFSSQLVRKNWLENRFWLRSYVKLNPEYSKLKSGTYLIQANMPMIDLLNLIVSGKEHQFQITFIEGSTFKQVLQQLAQHQHIDHLLDNLSLADVAKKLSITHQHPEGWLFPDTYAFTKGTSDINILKRAYIKMQNALTTQWQNRAPNLPYKNPYQALIMASIIEKESGKHAEHPRIASVFVNRLNKKMRLQTDPTVIYGLGDRYQGDITYAHLREKTAYNTYKIKGLPPTPIALPGAQALHAAMQPEKSRYLYFVSNGEGEHIFSTNLADHNRAVDKYQRNKN